MSVYELVKDAANLAKQVDNIELYSLLIDAKKESLDLLEENRNLKLKIKELEDTSELAKSLIFKNNCYYKPDDNNHDEPFCTNCWDNNHKLVRMHKFNTTLGTMVRCSVCKVDIYLK